MIAGNGYTIMGEDLGYYLPGYPVIVAISSLFIGDIEFSALLISTIVGSLTIPLTFLMIKTVSNEKVALLSSSLVLINPQHITHTSRAISEATATLLAVISIYVLILAIREKSNVMMWLCTFITGALFLTRYPSLLFIPIILVVLLLMRKWISWPSKTMFLAVTIVLLCLSSIWFLRNYLIFGDPFQSV
jgi:4-amino-4-deoxy-L-arabinose transferase-like glycosyltransferase